jgi:multiple sugar transport system ATP-binding protein
MASVSLKSVRKVYDNGIVAVNDFSIEIENEEFIVLVGPSGCGKSTALRMIAGLEDITSGEIYIGDRLVNDVSPKNRDIAMVFQNYALYPHMTVYENMAFGLKIRREAKGEIKRRVMEAATILDLDEDQLKRRPKALSGGQRQRVALGRAIVRNPQVFLFDEPLSNLDAKLRVQMRSEISKLHEKLKRTSIYVTHDQVEAMTMGSRIVVMKDGLIQQTDTPMNLYHHPANRFVAGFIGSPGMNFIDGSIQRENGQTVFVSEANASLKIVLPQDISAAIIAADSGKKLTLGIRPEDLYLDKAGAGSSASKGHPCFADIIEPMGNEIFFHMDAGIGSSLMCRARMNDTPERGAKFKLYMDLEKIHLFDAESGIAIV